MNQLVLVVLAFVIVMFLLNRTDNTEGYSSIVGTTSATNGHMDDFYLWRAYGHDVYNHCRLGNYPYNYKPKPHQKRFNYYNPYFYNYGYGHL